MWEMHKHSSFYPAKIYENLKLPQRKLFLKTAVDETVDKRATLWFCYWTHQWNKIKIKNKKKREF